MNPDESKLRHQERLEAESAAKQDAAELKFQTPEEVIRHDARQVSPPSSLAQRLSDSIAKEPKPSRSWWRRLLGR